MRTCETCGLIIKHVGDDVWIDNIQGECCRTTSKPHQPVPLSKETILAKEGAG